MRSTLPSAHPAQPRSMLGAGQRTEVLLSPQNEGPIAMMLCSKEAESSNKCYGDLKPGCLIGEQLG